MSLYKDRNIFVLTSFLFSKTHGKTQLHRFCDSDVSSFMHPPIRQSDTTWSRVIQAKMKASF